jgi:hypothetical protein
MTHLLVAILSLYSAFAMPVNVTTEISNIVPRMTLSGDQVRAQDGNILNVKVNGSFAMIGMLYGLCQYDGCKNSSLGACGFGPGRIAIYLSNDFGNTNWSDPVEILPASQRPVGIYFRPHMLFNPATRQFVLWVRWLPSLGPNLSDDPDLYLVATSPSLTTPFTIITVNVTMYWSNSADDNLFADEDGTAYIVHTSRGSNTTITVEQLSADWTSCLGATDPAARSAEIGPGHSEAPAMFRRDRGGMPAYYVLFAPLCCYCASGSPTQAYVSSKPLGPYVPAGDLGNAPGAQGNFVFMHADIPGTVLWSGNRWGSAPDGMFDHAFQYWTPLAFDAISGDVLPIVWQDSFNITVSVDSSPNGVVGKSMT